MRIGVDIDNVLSNFNEVLLEEYIKHDKNLRDNGIVHKDAYIREMFDWSKEEELCFYKENIERMAERFKPINEASKYIKKLRKVGNEIFIISGRDNGEYSNPYKITTEWLEKYNIEYDKLFLTNAYNSHEKTEICLQYDISFMIDDSIELCKDAEEYGIKALLMDTPYNRNENDIKRVKNWKEIYDYIMEQKNKKINVILDTDTCNECDDQFALSYMIQSQDIFNIEAITVAPCSHKAENLTVKNSQELSFNEIIKICKWLNFDTTNKVFKGSMDYIQNGYNEKNEAVNKIIEIALKNEKTYILAIGAITNVALAILKEPKIIDKIEVIWLGGNEIGYENNLEYNFRQDVEAVKIVFNSKVKLTVFPCKNVVSKLKIHIKPLKENLENKSELCNYLISKFYNDGYHGVQESRVIWDISVIAYMINKSWFETRKISCPNIKDDTSYEITSINHNITFVTNLDREKIYKDLFSKLINNIDKGE